MIHPRVSSTNSPLLAFVQRDFVVELFWGIGAWPNKVWDFVEGCFGVAVECASDPLFAIL